MAFRDITSAWEDPRKPGRKPYRPQSPTYPTAKYDPSGRLESRARKMRREEAYWRSRNEPMTVRTREVDGLPEEEVVRRAMVHGNTEGWTQYELAKILGPAFSPTAVRRCLRILRERGHVDYIAAKDIGESHRRYWLTQEGQRV